MAVGRKVVAPGQVIGSDWGNWAWDQSVNRFASAADRTNQWATPHEGALSFLEDTKQTQQYVNGAWETRGGVSQSAATWTGIRSGDTNSAQNVKLANVTVATSALPAGARLLILGHPIFSGTTGNEVWHGFTINTVDSGVSFPVNVLAAGKMSVTLSAIYTVTAAGVVTCTLDATNVSGTLYVFTHSRLTVARIA